MLVDADDEQNLRDITAMHQGLGRQRPACFRLMTQRARPCREDGRCRAGRLGTGRRLCQPGPDGRGLRGARQDLGADLRFDCAVTAAAREGSGWKVTLGNGETVSAGQVVLCTGNWSRPVGALFGLDLPVTPVRAQIVVLERPASFAGVFPVVSDLINLAYFRADGAQRDVGRLVGQCRLAGGAAAPDGYDEGVGAPGR